ncbi:MAG: iron chelate uptake ABC transporter family permease subunit [Alphaproteobacteria bacterium]|nr:iron chelate uptake ABC transporter family permease subunit [Alphaproteobacteria bacterium]
MSASAGNPRALNIGAADFAIASLAAAGVVLIFAACLIGSTPLSPVRTFAALVGAGTESERIIVLDIRLSRALAAYVVGFALAASGAALQGLLRNPLAEPGIIGVSASASLGATFVLYYGLAGLSPFMMPIGAIIGAVAATALIVAAAIRVRSAVTLILIGVGVSSFAGSVMSLLMNLAPNPFTLAEMVTWMLGSVANRSFVDIAFAMPFIGGGLGVLFASSRGLSALSLGEEAAASLGVDLGRLRALIALGAGLAAGGAVALAGAIGFIGVVAPHLVRPLVDQDPARTLLPAGLLGGAALVAADIIVRLLPTANELRLGVVAALVGAPAFIAIAIRTRPRHD